MSPKGCTLKKQCKVSSSESEDRFLNDNMENYLTFLQLCYKKFGQSKMSDHFLSKNGLAPCAPQDVSLER